MRLEETGSWFFNPMNLCNPPEADKSVDNPKRIFVHRLTGLQEQETEQKLTQALFA